MTEARRVRYERDGAIAELVLDRPEKLNAIDTRMIAELHEALDRAEGDEAVRAILLRGAGRAFSAGFDLDDDDPGASDPTEFWRAALQRDFDVIMRFWDSPKPTVAAVHGYCLGSATEIAAACDVTVAAEGCRFGVPEVRFGSGIVSLILPWVIGPKAAKELLLTGDDQVSAARVLALGLVNRVCDEAAVVDEARTVCRRMAANDRLAVQLTKRAINRSYEIMGMRQALAEALEIDVQIEATETPESKAFSARVAEQGRKAALAWRAAQAGLPPDSAPDKAPTTRKGREEEGRG